MYNYVLEDHDEGSGVTAIHLQHTKHYTQDEFSKLAGTVFDQIRLSKAKKLAKKFKADLEDTLAFNATRQDGLTKISVYASSWWDCMSEVSAKLCKKHGFTELKLSGTYQGHYLSRFAIDDKANDFCRRFNKKYLGIEE